MNVGDIIRFKKTGHAGTVTHIRYGATSWETVVTVLVHGKLFAQRNRDYCSDNATTFTLRRLRDEAEVISEAR